jgi:multicomponent Na+:H+ antiporter subunit D
MSPNILDFAGAQAPFLVAAIPFLGAALIVIGGPGRLSWFIASAAAILAAWISWGVALSALSGQGAFVDSAVLQVDQAGALGVAIVTSLSALVVIAIGATLGEWSDRNGPFALALALCCSGGWTGALLAQNWIGLVLAVEVAALASAGIIALSGAREHGALNGAWRMFIAFGVASAFGLLGIAMISRTDGSLTIAALSSAHIGAGQMATLGAGLVFVGLAVRAGVAPLHAWMGAAFGRGAAAATMIVGVVSISGALTVIARVVAYAIRAPEIGAGLSFALGSLGAASAVIGSMQAIGAQSLPRLAGYAIAAQAGCILLSLALGSPAGFAAAMLQIIALSASSLAFFGGAAAGRVRSLSALDGYARRAPLASAAITAGALSLMAAPLSIGFLGRWRLIEAGVGAGWWWASLVVIFTSLAAVFYGGRLVERIYFRRAVETSEGRTSLWNLALAPALLVSIAVIATGMAPRALLQLASAASLMLSGQAP